jgi:hypothetical protein
MFKRSLLGLAVAASAFAAIPQAANAWVAAGVLRCTVGAGAGYVVGSRRNIACNYYNPYGELEVYDGVIATTGLDVGYTSISGMSWAVIAPTRNLRGALQGDYVGAGLQATVAVGVGGNGMVGGFDNSINLQPFNVSGQEGLNAQLGFTGMSLRLRATAPQPVYRHRRH